MIGGRAMIAYVSIGNSDDKLTQVEWSRFVIDFSAMVVSLASQTHGAWFSHPASPRQNACWCLEFASEAMAQTAKDEARSLAAKYRQDSIAWAVAETEFLTP